MLQVRQLREGRTHGKSIKVIDQRTFPFDGVDFNRILKSLPVPREDDDGFGFYFRGDFQADLLEFAVCGMLGFFHYVGPAVGEEVDWCAWGCHVCRDYGIRLLF